MRSVVLTLLLAFVVGSASTPVAAQAESVPQWEEHCVVNVRSDDALNLRAGPGTQYAVLGQLRYNQCNVFVTGACRGDWCPVEDGHYAGWAHRHYITLVSPAMYCVTGVADGDVLNLRAWPSTSSRILAGLAPNLCGIAFLPYARDGWQKVRAGGWEGWVNRSYLTGQ